MNWPPAQRKPQRFSLPCGGIFGYICRGAVVVVEALSVRSFLTGVPTMLVLGILLSIAAIGVFCWLLFTLAVFALPFFVGVTAGDLAYRTGAGLPGALLVGIVAAGLTLGLGEILLGSVRLLWARVIIVLVFVGPAVIAGYHATHGIVKHTMPSEAWQTVFSGLGAIAVGAVALVRLAGIAGATRPARGLVKH
jgi:hypothetical protein